MPNGYLHRDFGLVIAYVLPGLTVVFGVEFLFPHPSLNLWTPGGQNTIGEFLLIAFTSLSVGLLVSAIRWMLVDTIHHHTGVPPPDLDFSGLPERFEAFELMVEHYYRYYQFYANTLVALFVVTIGSHVVGTSWSVLGYMAMGTLAVVLFLASRDSLRRYYSRSLRLMN